MPTKKTDRFDLTTDDYQTVLAAIRQIYGDDAANQTDNPFSDTNVEYALIDYYPHSDIEVIDDQFYNFFQDLMNDLGADIEEGFDKDTWVNADNHDETISVADVYHVIETNYPKY